MLDVRKIRVVSVDPDRRSGDTIAYLDENGAWQDPYGGLFDEREQAELHAVLSGAGPAVYHPTWGVGERARVMDGVLVRVVVTL